MTHPFFEGLSPVRYEGPDSDNPLAFRHYDPDAVVMGKRMEEHLRFAVAYWHSFAWEGGDPFGGQTFSRPWYPQDDMAMARVKADCAFDLFDILGQPFFCWHDADIRPEGDSFAESFDRFTQIIDLFEERMGEPQGPPAVGHRQHVLAPPLDGGRFDQSRPGCLRLRGRHCENVHGCDAPAGRAELCAVGWARRV